MRRHTDSSYAYRSYINRSDTGISSTHLVYILISIVLLWGCGAPPVELSDTSSSARAEAERKEEVKLTSRSLSMSVESPRADSDTRGAKRVLSVQRSAPRDSKTRTALVIGNGAYQAQPLRNPIRDARAIASALKALGFNLIGSAAHTDLNQKQMKRLIIKFGRTLKRDGGVGLFYYAGHGMQVNGKNYLIPLEAEIDGEEYVDVEAVDVNMVMAAIDSARNRMNLILLDACRDNPFQRAWRSSASGLASINAPSGTLLAYATAPGSVAADGQGENGVYTAALLRNINRPGLAVEEVFKRVRVEVKRETQGRQVPWESSSLEGSFYFKRVAGACPAACMPRCDPKCTQAVSVIKSAQEKAEEAQSRRDRLKAEVNQLIKWVKIPSGSLLMGSEESDAAERPVREVKLKAFSIAETEVTVRQYQKCVEARVCTPPSWNECVVWDQGEWVIGVAPPAFREPERPVICVDWGQARTFSRWVGGDLPTEAQWEYAARGEGDLPYAGGEEPNAVSWYRDNAEGVTHPVRQKRPNRYGLYDMSGNVWEWVLDRYKKSYEGAPLNGETPVGELPPCETRCERGRFARVGRGGSWNSNALVLWVINRDYSAPDFKVFNLGFRPVLRRR